MKAEGLGVLDEALQVARVRRLHGRYPYSDLQLSHWLRLHAGELGAQQTGRVGGWVRRHRLAVIFGVYFEGQQHGPFRGEDGGQLLLQYAEVGERLGAAVARGLRQPSEVDVLAARDRLLAGGLVDAVDEDEVVEVGRRSARDAGQGTELHQQAAVAV